MDLLLLLKTDDVEQRVRYAAAAQITAQKAEIKRLREALQSIACTDADCSCVKSFGSPTENCVYGKARAALGEEK